MLSFLTISSFATSIHLSAENASLILEDLSGPRIFLMLRANWCEHCNALVPIWESLSANTSTFWNVVFADIECQSNQRFCRRFEGETYPRFYWIDPPSNTTVRYLGERDTTHFSMFLTKQATFPLIPFDSIFLSTSDQLTVFVFSHQADENQWLSQAIEIATRFRHIESRFLIETSAQNNLSAITSPNRRIYYHGEQ
jgi:thiol-disulfide isomerase/thioredoxin